MESIFKVIQTPATGTGYQYILHEKTDLNPIKLIWVSIKEYVARKNVSFCLDDAMKLAEEEFNIVTKEEWSSMCNNAHQCEQNYLRMEPIIDDISEQILINLQNDSDNSSCSSSEEEK
jgi:hypothetical protein